LAIAVELHGTGEASISCLFAAAIAPVELSLHPDTGWFRGSDADYLHSFVVPRIERAGRVGAVTDSTDFRGCLLSNLGAHELPPL
jgi:hypothetical protein